MKKLNKLLCTLLCLFVLLAAFAMPASAAGKLDPSVECSLTLYYVDGETPLEGAEFAIYRVADIDENAAFTLTDAFKAYPVDFSQIADNANWAKLALTLAGFVERDAIKETAHETTNDNGAISIEHLRSGLYLILGGACETDTGIYTGIPALVSLPSMNEAGEYFYDVMVYPKHEKVDIPGQPISIKVLKSWKDNNNPNRPREIQVDLLCDGKVYETVKLNRDNAWTYRWENLEAGHSWNVSEHEVKGYSVEVTKDGWSFTITNSGSFVPPEPPPHNPQTGLLWWPVPVLFGAGLLFVVLAVIRRRKSLQPKEK